jgi:1,4-alpha-glucan branching enzyme
MLTFMRKSREGNQLILAVFNFTPVPRHHYRVGVPRGGYWHEILNSDSETYGGAGYGNLGGTEANEVPAHGRKQSLNLIVPPLGAVFFKSG